jgi:enamine deaminase RidA (YjgF/YER057c/UK114 family)
MTLKITRVNPDQLHTPPGYHHITIVETGRMAFLAGQCPIDAAGDLVGEGDVNAQVDQVVANAMTALGAVGAEPDDVVRTVIYVVTDGTTELGAVWERLVQSPLGPAFTSAGTLLGVSRLGFRGQLVEIDFTAALPTDPPNPGHG